MSTFKNEEKLSTFLCVDNMDEWTDPEVWKLIIPDLTCDSTTATCIYPNQRATTSNSTEDGQSQSTKDLINNGYTLINEGASQSSLEEISKGILKLHKIHKIPATFILLYDQAWQLSVYGMQTLQQISHSKNIFNFDVLAWYIDPSDGAAGFSPHRDRQPPNDLVSQSFHKDGQAKYCTLWMALTDATPENSCLYVIPKQFDPGYLKGDDGDDDGDDGDNENENAQDPLTRCLQTKESYQNIRALPRKAGESITFTHRIIHWGSRGNSSCKDPRIAISFVVSDPSFEKPYLKNFEKYLKQTTGESEAHNGKELCLPPFYVRLLLVCAQLLIYYQRFNLPKESARACYKYCKKYKDELEESYWKKVSFEFVNAMKEGESSVRYSNDKNDDGMDEKNGGVERKDSEYGDEDEDEDESLMEAMLENADNIEDDFDALGNNDEERGGSMSEEDFDDDLEEHANLFAPIGQEEPHQKRRKKCS